MQFKKLLVVPFALLGATAMAQPTITANNFNPVAGDVFTAHTLTTVPSEGASGANATWDFSNLTASGTNLVYTWTNCNGGCSSYAGANMVDNDNGGNVTYYANTASKYTLAGVYSGGVSIPYSDGEDALHYPMTYQSTFTDAFAASFTSGVAFDRSGTVTVTADGYGTLKTPANTFSNALRLHIVEDYSDVAGGFGTITYHSDEYAWVVPGTHSIVFEIYNFTTSGSTSSTAVYSTVTATDVPQVALAESSLKVYPNPATTAMNVDFATDSKANVAVTLMDVTGRTVATLANGATEAGQQHYSYPTSGLPRGVYYLRLQSGSTNLTRKVEVL